MTGRSKAIFAFALALLALVLLGTSHHGTGPSGLLDPQMPAKEQGNAATAAADASLPPPPPSPQGTTRLAPLPPHDAPLAQTLTDLLARAEAGDRSATCRLGLELLRCDQVKSFQRLTEGQLDRAEAELAAAGELVAANSIAENALWNLERIKQCQAVPLELADQGARYLRQSALAGNPYAMTAYASGTHWPPDLRGIAIDPDFDRWRQEAPGLLQAALRAGSPEAAFMLQLSYVDDNSFLTALVPDDPYQGFVHNLLSARLFGHQERDVWARQLDAAAMERARDEAARMHERYFDGRRFPQERTIQAPIYIQPRNGEPMDHCDEST